MGRRVNLYDVVKTAATMTDSVLVSYSGGKDAAVVLDLCTRHFREVKACFMYLAPGLSFQERILRWAEKRYCVEMLRIPHFSIGEMIRDGTWGQPDPAYSAISIGQISDYMREVSGYHWIATGERMTESITRRGWMTKWGTINERTGRIYPVAHWRKTHVLSYIKEHNLQVGEDYLRFGRQLNDLMPETLWLINKHYPEDYARLKAVWPHVEVGVAWWDMYGEGRKSQGSQSR